MNATIAVDNLLEAIAGTHEPSDELMNSIQRHGVLLPILITPEDKVIDGRRRLMAAHRLGISDIPYEVVHPEDESDEAAMEISVHATRSRNFITEYEACCTLRDAGHTTSEIAKLTGLTHQQVNGLWRFDNVIPEVWEAVQQGRVSGNHLRQALVKMSREQQLEVLAADKITWRLLREVRQVQVEEAWDDLDLPDIGDGGAQRSDHGEECPSAKRYNGSNGCLHQEMLKDTIRFFEGRTGRPTSWKAAAEAIRALWNIEED